MNTAQSLVWLQIFTDSRQMQCRGEHHEACGHGHHHHEECDHEQEDINGDSLFSAIDTSKVRCLNECVTGSCVNPIKPYDKRHESEPRLDSHDDDPELILYIPFTRVVKIKSISIIGGYAGEGTSPAKIKLFINREDIDFSNCQELPAIQEIELIDHAADSSEGGRGNIDYPVKMSKFQNVSNLSIFVSENFGGDLTSISYVGFKGEITTARHGVVECVYESAPQMADHKTKPDFSVPDVAGN